LELGQFDNENKMKILSVININHDYIDHANLNHDNINHYNINIEKVYHDNIILSKLVTLTELFIIIDHINWMIYYQWSH
jgi:hypothetical protein